MKALAAKHRHARGVREKDHTSRESGKGGTKSLLKSRGSWVEDGGRQLGGRRWKTEGVDKD